MLSQRSVVGQPSQEKTWWSLPLALTLLQKPDKPELMLKMITFQVLWFSKTEKTWGEGKPCKMLTLQGTESRYAQRKELAKRMDKEDSLILMQQSLPLWKHAWMWCVGASIFSCTIESERKTKIKENTKRRFHVIESGEHGHAEWLEQLVFTM
jgi:hypothetical protein